MNTTTRLLAGAVVFVLTGCASENEQRDIAILSALAGTVDAFEDAKEGEWIYVQDYSTTTRFQFAAVQSEIYTMMMSCIVIDAREQKAVVMLYSETAQMPTEPQTVTWLFDGEQPLEMTLDLVPPNDDGWAMQGHAEPAGSQFHTRASRAKKSITAIGVPPIGGAGTISAHFAVDTEIASKSNCQ